MTEISIEYLNHAALLVEVGSARVLSDPWFMGTAFSGGWGLRYDNPNALERAATATHCWISHWHSDHLHAPTLDALAQKNPKIEILANVSANFSMVDRLKSFGFEKVTPLYERTELKLNERLRCERFPTAGIDNMLLLRTAEWTILNYNDCNLPAAAIRRLRKRIGPVDLLFTNYNHAGKLFDTLDDDARKRQLVDTFVRTVDALAPKRVIPFASSHYYRTAASKDQNSSLLSFDELEHTTADDRRVSVLRIGDRAVCRNHQAIEITYRNPPLEPQPELEHEYRETIAWEQLVNDIAPRCVNLGRQFLRLGGRLAPPLRVYVEDHDRTLVLRVGEPPVEAPDGPAHIAAHSEAVHLWLARRFGDDTFVAGAHFRIVDTDTKAIERWALFTLLEASHLDPERCLQYIRENEGRRFLWNRREEVLATLFGARFKAGQMRI